MTSESPVAHERWADLLDEEARKRRRDMLLDERFKFKIKVCDAIKIGEPVLADSPLLDHLHDITDEDAQTIRALIAELTKIAGSTPNVVDHLHLTGEFARRIGERCNGLGLSDKEDGYELNVHQLEVEGLLNDVGRLIGQQRYQRNELEGKALLKKLGLDERLLYVEDIRSDKMDAEHLSLHEQILIIADVCGKRETDGRIRTFEQAMGYHYGTRRDPASYQKKLVGGQAVFASELRGLRTMQDDVHRFGALYKGIYERLCHEGVDIDQIREEIEKDESTRKLES